MAAFEAPYAPHVEYAPVETPEEVKIKQPWLSRNVGIAALACLCQEQDELRRLKTHECNSAEQVDVKKLLPSFDVTGLDLRHGIHHAMIDNYAIQSSKSFKSNVYRFLCERNISQVPRKY